MTDEQTKQAILGFAEFFKGITGNQNLEIPSEIAEKCGIQAQADGEYIPKQAVIEQVKDWMNTELRDKTNALHYLEKRLNELPSVSILPNHDGCRDCRWQEQTEKDMPCRECKQNYTDMWEKSVAIPNKTGHWIDLREDNEMSDDDTWRYSCNMCHSQNFRKTLYCPNCGCAMVESQEGAKNEDRD